MTTHHRIRPSYFLNRRTLKLLTVLGTVAAVCTAVISALGALLMVRQLQLISLQRRTLPVLRQAAQLYLDQNAPEPAPNPRRRSFLFPRVKKAAPAPAEEPADVTDNSQDEIPF